MDLLVLGLMAFLVSKIVDFGKFITNRDINGMVTQLLTWVAGVVVVFLGANTDWADGIPVGTDSLGSLGWPSLLLLGLTISSSASFLYDARAAVDNTDSAAMPRLLPSTPFVGDDNPVRGTADTRKNRRDRRRD
jgi:hypothetical protein